MPPGWRSDSSRIQKSSKPTGKSRKLGIRKWTRPLASASIISGRKRSRVVSTGLSRDRHILRTRGCSTMHGPMFGEFMGTLVLILLGDGVVANVLLRRSKGENSGWIVIATAWGMAVVAGICTAVACGSPAAHINPAITLAVAILSGEWSHVPWVLAPQLLGA